MDINDFLLTNVFSTPIYLQVFILGAILVIVNVVVAFIIITNSSRSSAGYEYPTLEDYSSEGFKAKNYENSRGTIKTRTRK